MFAIFLVSCKEDPETPKLTAIAFAGVDDATIEFNTEFNVLTGVTAKGNDDVDYTSDITYVTRNFRIRFIKYSENWKTRDSL